MSGEAQSYYNSAPSDKDTPQQDRGLFDHESKKHECHHYARMYGGQAVNAMMWGFGATLGADAANAAVGEMRVCFVQSCNSRIMLTMVVAMVETLRNESYESRNETNSRTTSTPGLQRGGDDQVDYV
jgi:hypothetical protein